MDINGSSLIDEKYTKYAQDVLAGRIIAGNYIKLACKRYLKFLERDDIYFDTSKCDRVINFISKLKHFSGKTSGKHFILEEWQKWIIYNIFGFYYKDTGHRVTTKAYILVARKNGKSCFASALCLYGLLADEEDGAQVLNVANSKEQGKLLFDMECGLVKSIDPKGKYLKTYRDRIKFLEKNSYSRCLSADSKGLDGLSASFFVCDETHEYTDSKLWDVLISSQGFRDNPLAIQISTSGFRLFDFCRKYRDMCINILKELAVDDTQFSAIYEMDEGDDWQLEENWIKANPNIDVTVSRKYLKDQVIMAKNNTSLEVGIRTKNFNQWVSSQVTWIDDDIVSNASQDLKWLPTLNGKEAYCGVDLSAVSDLTAMSIMIVDDDRLIFKNKYYLPQSCLDNNSNKELYKRWAQSGMLTITEGNVVDYDYVTNDLVKLNEQFNIQKVAYDSYNATQWAINTEAAGLPLEPYGQSLGNFNRATKEFERLLKQGKIIIENNEITRWCINNVTLKYDYCENCKPVKTSKQQKIDGVIAMLEALGTYLNVPHWNNIIG